MPGQPEKHMNKPGKNNKTRTVYGPVATVFASVNTGSWRILRPGPDHSRCAGCGQCETFCPTGVIEIIDDPAKEGGRGKVVEIDWAYCKGCGICADVCPKKCIRMVEEKKGNENEERN
ncbi:MAG: pyruvate ferredoxin oxidoreductase delta subunit [Acidobacteriota bacterium]|nr:pyruvate ferredoxin oxidoreductase delta subunit [Acidobacteriota bacterium]